ncbi:choice-of-anchor D domain-containing protein [Myxococcota bacterium]|nr:choice-of-anchor D domain-containing protein [Myxococcota bacterium]
MSRTRISLIPLALSLSAALTACVGLSTVPAKDVIPEDTGEQAFGDLTISTTALDFGEVGEGESSSRSLTLENTGDLAVAITDLSLDGSSAFSVTTTLLNDIEPGGTQVIDLLFAPEDLGGHSATLTLATDAPGAESVEISLSGSLGDGSGGDEGGDDSDEPTTAMVSVTPLTVDFGTIDLGKSGSELMTITNSGSEGVLVKSISASSAVFSWGKEFSVPYMLDAGSARTFTVTYTPTAEKSDTGTVTVATDDPNASSIVVNVSGAGFDRCDLCYGLPYIDTGSSAYIDFGFVTSTTTKSVDVQNVGDMDLTISSIYAENGADFLGISTGTFVIGGFSGSKTLAPGTSLTFTITYKLAGQATIDGSSDNFVHIISDSAHTADYKVALNGICLSETGCI